MESSMPTSANELKSVAAARFALLSIIGYQVLLLILILLRPDLDPYWHPLSEWALGRFGWVMIGAFLLAAASYGALFYSLRTSITGVAGKMGLAILGICVFGTIGVGIFVTDPMYIVTDANPPPITLSTTGTLHIVCGSSALMLLPFAAMLLNWQLAKKMFWERHRTLLLLTGFLPFLGLIGFLLHTILILIPMGEYAYGPEVPLGYPARLLFFTYMIWVVSVAWVRIRIHRDSKNPS